MRRIIIGVLISMLVLSSGMGAFTSATTQKKSIDPEPIADYSHNVLGEFFTLTTCVPCKYSHTALKNIYAAGWHPFYYVTYVSDKNNNSNQRKNELNVYGSPTEVWDGGYKYNIGGSGETETEMEKFNISIIQCGARTVKDIDIDMDVEWLGAVNNHPEDGETGVPIEVVFNWTISEFRIDINVTNNEPSYYYNGHVHIQTTEVESEWWNDKFGFPYTFEFKSYAFNGDVPLNAGQTWSKTIYYDGCDHNDADNPPRYFDHIDEDNIQVIASVFNKNNSKYVDECIGVRIGENTDPKKFDVYFGDTNPPPKVISNGSAPKYDPPGNLNWTTTYYWKVDVWNNLGEFRPGKVWSFTTRGNDPPNEPINPNPYNGSTTAPINVNLSWFCNDPDGDDLTYDIYFEEFDPFDDPELVKSGHIGRSYDPSPLDTLDFDTKYEWQIVAWDEYGLNSTGEIWWFQTEPNYPPNPATNLRPKNGANGVPVNATLKWNGSDPNEGDTLRYDVYFGLYDPPTKQTTKQLEREYDPYEEDDMQLYETYYWKIGTWDKSGEYSETAVHSFKTGVNYEPTDPVINGPSEGGTGVKYDFKFVSTDPEDNLIKYTVEWGDGTTNQTTLVPNGTEVTLSHSWATKDTYTIRARATDEFGAHSDWKEHKIKIPRNKVIGQNNLILNWLSERFPYMFQMLKYLLEL